MTRDEFMRTIDELAKALGLPKNTADAVRHIAEMAYSEGELAGRRSGLEDAGKLVEANA